MSKWLILIPFLMAFSPIYEKHETTEKIDTEIKEIEQTTHPKQWGILNATPTLTDLEDRQVVIVSSNGWSTIMWRFNREIYQIKGSCVTVLRGD